MRVSILCKDREDSDFIYDLLTNPLSGCSVLSGEKTCIDSHEILPDVMEFDLTQKEIDTLNKNDKIIRINEDSQEVTHWYTKTSQNGIPRLASKTTSFNGLSVTDCIPNHLLYCQDYNLNYTQTGITSGMFVSLSSIDCSNVDILVLDSGVDATHPDLTDSNDTSTVVNFNWTLLREGNPVSGTQIVTTQSANYYQDSDGHGTACASLVAGKRCGFAKNAKIYALRSNELGATADGFSITQCMRLAIAFQLAKQNNLHGLSSTRSTIWTNSWGYVGSYISNDVTGVEQNTLDFYYSIGGGKTTGFFNYNRLQGENSSADSYFRSAISNGIHTLVAAGNNNIYLTNNSVSAFNCINFRKFGSNFVILRTLTNNTSYTLNTEYGSYLAGSTTGLLYGTVSWYGSPNIGYNVSGGKATYPIIYVGDIIPIGFNDAAANQIWTAGNALAAYTVLSGTNSESRILINNSTRYNTLSGPFFIKSAYSSFGPDVDIYTPGNGAWAALSNQAANPGVGEFFTVSNNNKYQFFNGTSSACPIAAGILATYLSEFPSSSPASAKSWLLSNAVSGNIMQTEMTTVAVSSYNGTTTTVHNLPFGSNSSSMQTNSNYRLQNGDVTYNTANISDLLFCNRFFGTNNLIAQAFPLRKAVLRNSNTTVNALGTTLNIDSITDQKITHTII